MTVEAIVAGVIASLIASLAFWSYFFFLRPQIRIATAISKEKDLKGGGVYYIKFLNQGRCAITDVTCELAIAREEASGTSGGKMLRRQVIPLRNSEFRYLPGRPLRTTNGIAENAKRVVFDNSNFDRGQTLEDVIGSEGFFLEIGIFARHSISGHAGFATMRFVDPKVIKLKSYKPGSTLQIEE